MEVKLDNYFISEKMFEEIQNNTDIKVEYMNGEILYSSTTSLEHNEIVANFLIEIKKYLKDKDCKVYNEQIEVIMAKENDLCKFKPDLFVVCKGNYSIKGESIVGIPEIIFEVVSKGNSSNDTIYKFNKYLKFGVKEYNLVHQNGRIVQYELKDNNYELREVYHKEDVFTSSVLTGISIDLNQIFTLN